MNQQGNNQYNSQQSNGRYKSNNHFRCKGFVVMDPWFGSNANKTKSAKLRIVVSEGRDDKNAMFINVWLRNGKVDLIRGKVRKGSLVGVEGSIRLNSYATRNGEKRTDIELNALEVDLIQPWSSVNRGQADNAPQQQQPSQPYSNGNDQPPMQNQQPFDNGPVTDDDLPF